MSDKEKTEAKLILLSAGGTGGHMFPAAALAHDMLSRGYRVALVTDKRGIAFKDAFGDIPVTVLPAGTPGAKGIAGKIKGLIGLGLGFLKAFSVVGNLKPAVVVGFGGYPSVPAVAIAQQKNIPTVIHEQNAVLGKANAFLAPKADRIALSSPHVDRMAGADAVRAVVTGNPVREEISALYTKPYPALEGGGPLKLFIVGGSLGAQIFSDVVPAALSVLPEEDRTRLDIVQQCRAEDIERVQSAYVTSGIRARLASFFDDIPEILENTHLVIARSGASTAAELTTAGRPAIFVPYPHHKDQQQKANAQTIAEAGGGWMIEENVFTADTLSRKIEAFLRAPESLFLAAEAARSLGKPDAARRLGNLVTALAAGWDKDGARPFDLTQGRRG